MADNAYLAFLRDPDQAARRAELAAYIGPNADKFMPIYDRLQGDATTGTGRPRFRLFGSGFCVPAFFCGPVWFFYRRMWVIAGIITIGMVLLAFIPGTSRLGVPLGVALAVMGHQVYIQQAIGAIQKLRRGDATVDPVVLAEAGGVSKTAGWISGVIYGLVSLAALASIIYLASIGEPIPR